MAAQSTSKPTFSDHILVADERKVFGRKVKQLRRDGILPANVYGHSIKSIAVQVPAKEFEKIFSEVGETGLVALQAGGEVRPVLIHHIQRDAVSDKPLHTDFLQVNLKEKVTATVQIEFVGESPIEKTQEGIVVPQIREVEVEALPTDLPEKIEVDISSLVAVGDTIKVADLKIDRTKVEIKEEDTERIVVSVDEPAKEEVVEAQVVVEGVEGAEGAPAEGETPAEGENPPAGGPVGGAKEGEEKKEE